MKKIVTNRIFIGVVCFILGFAIASTTTNNNQIIKETDKTAQTSTDNKQESSTDNKPTESKILQMELGKEYTVNSGSGDYTISIEGIRFTKERNEFSDKKAEKVFFLDYNYSNISQTDETFISSTNFKIMDDEGNVLDSYPVSDDNRIAKTLPVGGKCKATEAYAMPKASKKIKVLFYDNMFLEPTGQIEIETGL